MNVDYNKTAIALSIAAALALGGCADGDSTNLTTDVTVVDGYITSGLVKDDSGQIATLKDGSKGLYTFASTPTYPITFTVGDGKFYDTNATFDINMTTNSGTVISPITTLIGNDTAIKSNLQFLMGSLNDATFDADYIDANNTELAKLAQLCYAALKDTNTANDLKNRLGSAYNSSLDANLTALIDNTIASSNTNRFIDEFLAAVKGFSGTAANIEQSLTTVKALTSLEIFDGNKTELLALIASYDSNLSTDEYSTTTAQLAKQIQYANVSGITDMSSLFTYKSNFNIDISKWDVSHVTNMSYMFNSAAAFNQPIGNWDTSAVTNMNSMFTSSSRFNQPIGDWNTSAVTDMSFMFASATAFNQPIGNWNTSTVTNMNNMFSGAGAFNQPIANWDTSTVTNMNNMFSWTGAFNQPIGNWNTSAVIDMEQIFWFASAFNQDISTWTIGTNTKTFSADDDSLIQGTSKSPF